MLHWKRLFPLPVQNTFISDLLKTLHTRITRIFKGNQKVAKFFFVFFTLKYFLFPLNLADGSTVRSSLYHQLVELCDLILDGYRTQLETISNEERKMAVVFKQYEKDRAALIMPLGNHDKWRCAIVFFSPSCILAFKVLSLNTLKI